MEVRAGMVFIQQGDPKNWTHRLIQLAERSWWVHGWIAVTPTLAVEATLPSLRHLNGGGVKIINIQDRLDYVKSYGGDVAVMDLPGLTDDERQRVADAALSYVGWKYNWLNCLFFFIFRIWLRTTRKELNCSFLMARSFWDGIARRIFTKESLKMLPWSEIGRKDDLEAGLCTPDEIFRYSELVEIERIKY